MPSNHHLTCLLILLLIFSPSNPSLVLPSNHPPPCLPIMLLIVLPSNPFLIEPLNHHLLIFAFQSPALKCTVQSLSLVFFLPITLVFHSTLLPFYQYVALQAPLYYAFQSSIHFLMESGHGNDLMTK